MAIAISFFLFSGNPRLGKKLVALRQNVIFLTKFVMTRRALLFLTNPERLKLPYLSNNQWFKKIL
jgi:hypothetical protein